MKMSKATEQDIDAAINLSSFIDSLNSGFVPESALEDGCEHELLHMNDGEQCCRIVESLVGICRKGSVGRVVWGMEVICDPRNEVIDPDADTLEIHPKHLKAAQQRDALLSALSAMETDKDGDGFVCREAMEEIRETIQFAEGKGS